jgi:hypothetical protein
MAISIRNCQRRSSATIDLWQLMANPSVGILRFPLSWIGVGAFDGVLIQITLYFL